jgi:hypothetical protein
MFVATEACIILPSVCRAWRWGELQHQYRFEAAREAFEFFIVFENGPLMQVSSGIVANWPRNDLSTWPRNAARRPERSRKYRRRRRLKFSRDTRQQSPIVARIEFLQLSRNR